MKKILFMLATLCLMQKNSAVPESIQIPSDETLKNYFYQNQHGHVAEKTRLVSELGDRLFEDPSEIEKIIQAQLDNYACYREQAYRNNRATPEEIRQVKIATQQLKPSIMACVLQSAKNNPSPRSNS